MYGRMIEMIKKDSMRVLHGDMRDSHNAGLPLIDSLRFGAKVAPERVQKLTAIRGIPVDAKLDFEMPRIPAGRDEFARFELGDDRAFWQPGHTFAFQNQFLEDLGHVGFVVRPQSWGCVDPAEEECEAAAEIAGFRVRNQRQGTRGRARQPEYRRATWIRPADWHQYIDTYGEMFVPDWIEMERQFRMMIGKHQFAVAVHEHEDRVVDIGGYYPGTYLAETGSERF